MKLIVHATKSLHKYSLGDDVLMDSSFFLSKIRNLHFFNVKTSIIRNEGATRQLNMDLNLNLTAHASMKIVYKNVKY